MQGKGRQRPSPPQSCQGELMSSRRTAFLAASAVLLLTLSTVASAQPFGSWGIYDRSDPGNYFEIPHSPALNPTGQITIEGWVDIKDGNLGGGCSNIIGKGFQNAWWVGICGTQLRSYVRGSGSARTGGAIDQPGWHHFAVTFNGTQRCHYIDGRLFTCWDDGPGPLATSPDPVRIGDDIDFRGAVPNGSINEIRLWNVARTVSQIRSTINVRLTSPQPGLVAVWANGGPNDVVGPHDGVEVGSVPRLTFPVTTFGCTSTATTLCVRDRFTVSIKYESPVGDGQATRTNPSTFQSGIFWFFNPTNWEVMVKVLNGCPINNRYWVFSAATTNVFYRMDVFDQEGGENKVYFNYAGPPAPAVTDTIAFATCP